MIRHNPLRWQPLTPCQARILDAIVRHCRVYKRPPRVRDIQKALGVSNWNWVDAKIGELLGKGYIIRCESRLCVIRQHPINMDALVEANK